MTVNVMANGKQVKLESPYHPELPARAKALGGRFNSSDKSWTFDARDESRVRDLARAIYGTDGSSPADLVTIRYRCHRSEQVIWLAGREIARRPGRDSDVRLGQGVILIEGQFKRSGGSARYPAITWADGQAPLLEIRDVPADLARAEAEADPAHVQIVDEAPAPESVTIAVAGAGLDVLKALREKTDLSDAEIVTRALQFSMLRILEEVSDDNPV